MNPLHENDTDIDTGVLDALGGTFAGQSMTTSLDSVVARGRRTRNRHRAVAAGIGTSAAALVAAIGVLAPSSGGPAGPAVASGVTGATAAATSQNPVVVQKGGVDIENASFSVHTNADQTVLVTILDKQIFDVAALREAVTAAGIPADVRELTPPYDNKRSYQCKATPGVTMLDSKGILDFGVNVGKSQSPAPNDPARKAFTIKPSAMPAGSVLILWVYNAHNYDGTPSKVTEIGLAGGRPGDCVWEVNVLKK
jgi:hypothetical protein